MSRLFVSHSSTNNAEAVALFDWLAAEGWNEVFLDLDSERGITAGERWERALNEAASRCEAVLFLISREWLASRWCQRELNLAHRLNKRLFGALVEAIPHAELPTDLKDTWQLVDLTAGRDHVMLRAQLPHTQAEFHVTFSKDGLARLRNGLARAGLDPRFFAWPPKQDPDRPPYRGLKPFEAEDAGIFFGRDAPIVEALDALRGIKEAAAPRIVAILGASGAGKSSFLRAGLLPRLARDDRTFLPLPVLRPERAPISGEAGFVRALEAALAAQGIVQTRASIRDAVAAGADEVRPLLQKLVDKALVTLRADGSDAQPPVLLLAIDQAEELFLGEASREGQVLLELLGGLVKEDRPGLIALFTIRSDAYDWLETARAFEGLRQHTLPLLPMPRGAYQTVIEGPAARLKEVGRNLAIEPRLTQRLLKDIETGGGSDALPLLAFTLEQLYLDYGARGALKLGDYEAFGGIRGAIEAAVDRAFSAADADPRIPRDHMLRLTQLRRGLIPWLAGINAETGSPRRRIARLADIPREAEPLLRLLVEQRLLSTDRIVRRDGNKERSEITIEPAHEALLRQWGMLHGWLQEDFTALAALEGVKRAARDWAASYRQTDWLDHSGGRLDDTEKIAERVDLAGDLTIDARDYLRECRRRDTAIERERIERLEHEREEQERRLRDAQALAAANRIAARRTLFGLVVALLLAGLASWQWWKAQTETRMAEQAAQEARSQRDRAERALKLATDTANGLIFEIAAKFRDAAGVPASLVKDILDRARKLQDQLIEAGEQTSELRQSQASALDETAITLLALGDTDGALAAATQARAIIIELLVATPDRPDRQHLLSVAHIRIGDVLALRGRRDEALVAYRAAVSVAKALAAGDPDKVAWRHDLIATQQRLGALLEEQGRYDEALDAYREARAIAEALVAKEPGNAAWRRDLFVLELRISEVLAAQGKTAEALAVAGEAQAIAKARLAEDPGNTEGQRDLSVVDASIGGMLKSQGKLEEALAACRDALAIRRALTARDPENAGWQDDLANLISQIAEILQSQNKPDEALAAFREALAIGKALTAKDPDNIGWQAEVASAQRGIGWLLQTQGKLDEALGAFRDALAIDRMLATKDPGNPSRQLDLAAVNRGIAGVLQAQRKLDEALTAFREALAIDKLLVTRNPGNSGWQFELAAAEEGVGGTLQAQGKLDEALAAFREALAIDGQLVTRDPGNMGWQRELAVVERGVGGILQVQGKLDEALAAFRDALAIDRLLVAGDPGNMGWQLELAAAERGIGEILEVQGKPNEAFAAFRESLAIARALIARDAASPQARYELEHVVEGLGDVAYDFVLARQYDAALEASDAAIAAVPGAIWLQTNRAHALMMLGRTDEARAIYFRYRGEKNVREEKSWETIIDGDFAEMEKGGITSPLMAEIRERFAAAN